MLQFVIMQEFCICYFSWIFFLDRFLIPSPKLFHKVKDKLIMFDKVGKCPLTSYPSLPKYGPYPTQLKLVKVLILV